MPKVARETTMTNQMTVVMTIQNGYGLPPHWLAITSLDAEERASFLRWLDTVREGRAGKGRDE